MEINLEKVKECIRESQKLIVAGSNEQVVRDNFTSYLRQFFANTPSWVERHIKGSEAAVSMAKKGKRITGFVDNLVDLTAIEYEGNLKLKAKYESGYGQVKDYCASLINRSNKPEWVVGVLSDTIIWKAYIPNVVNAIDGKPLTRENIELKEIDSIEVSKGGDVDAHQLVSFLIKHLGRIGARPLSALSISDDLGFTSAFCIKHIDLLRKSGSRAFKDNPQYAQLIVQLWCNFVTYLRDKGSSNNFDFEGYVDELYILTLGKLICANFIAEKGLLSDDSELQSILDGSFFSSRGPVNFIEYDYFGWLNHDPYVQELLPVARGIQLDLQVYNFKDLPTEDIFGSMMAQLANRSQRILLGQEWTPSWLARQIVDRVVEQIPENEDLQLVDMCCGSGSFIVETLKVAKDRIAIEDRSAEDKITLLSKSITGFDIDPLAVMLSKINWLLNAKDWLDDISGISFSIPIYHADSLFAITPISELDEVTNEETFSLKIAEYEVQLPKFIITREFQGFFDSLLDKAYSIVLGSVGTPSLRISRKDLSAIINDLLSEADLDLSEDKTDEVITFALSFIITVDKLNRDGRNGIWAYILRNSYRPGLVSGQFNGLVANPPWLALSKLANNPYQAFLKRKAEEFGIKPEGPSHLHIELATIFLLHSIDRYLSPNAIIGCITPETVLNGHHQNLFRKHRYLKANHVVDFSINEIWLISEGTFKNNGIVLFGSKNKNQSKKETITGREVDSAGSRAITLYIHRQGERTAWSRNPQSENDEGFFEPANFRQGADIMPRTFFFYEVTRSQTLRNVLYNSIQSINPVTSTLAFAVKDAKKFKKFRITATTVPDKLMFDVFTSNLLTPFKISSPLKALLPIRKGAANVWEAIPNAELNAMSTSVRNVFSEICRNIGRHATPENLMELIDVRNKLTQQNIESGGYIVFTGAGGSNVCAAYIQATSSLTKKLIVDQTLYWTKVETEDEAIYLTGLLNSPAINSVIREFQPRGAFGERHIHKLPFGVTPPYDSEQASHQEVVEATKALIVEFRGHIRRNEKLQNALDPNTASLNRRRHVMQAALLELSSFPNYDQACRNLYGV